MKKTILPLIVLSGCLVLAGFTAKDQMGITGQSSQQSDAEAAKKEIALINSRFNESLQKGDAKGIASVYTTDAKYMAPNHPAILGRDKIEELYNRIGETDLVVSTVDVWGEKNMVTEEGTYTLKTNNGAQVEVGKYLALWKKVDGKWKIFRECYNAD